MQIYDDEAKAIAEATKIMKDVDVNNDGEVDFSGITPETTATTRFLIGRVLNGGNDEI